MSKAKHTPGEWKFDYPYILDEKGNYLAEIIESDEEGRFIDDYEECKANAKLMAAAPHLLYYLKDLIEQVNHFPQFRDGINMTYALEAIKQATE